MASAEIPDNGRLARSNEHLYIGGKGGEFRGIVECIHFTDLFSAELPEDIMPLMAEKSRGLYRFEEPIDVDETNYTIIGLGSDTSSVYSAATDGTTTTIKISTAEAQAMILKMTGKAHTTFTSSTVDFTLSPYSMGSYKVVNYVSSPGTASTMAVPHVPYNLLINPGAINRDTQKPNQKPLKEFVYTVLTQQPVCLLSAVFTLILTIWQRRRLAQLVFVVFFMTALQM